MFRVIDIEDEAKKVIGACDDARFFRWCGDAVSLVANKGDFEGWKGWIDICTAGCSCNGQTTCNDCCGNKCFTLPREVETVLAVNIGGRPALGFGTLFNFHLNGLGDCRQTCEWSWQDQGAWHVTFKDLITPSNVVAYLNTSEDNGKQLVLFGYDEDGNVLRRQVSGQWQNGILIPTIYGVAVPDMTQPKIARITGVFKEKTAGSIRLATTDGKTLAIYEPDETLPQYRRIKINRSCNWVRVAYRKTTPIFSSRFDHVPMRSRLSFLLAMQALKHYNVFQLAEAHAAEVDAARLEIESQDKAEPTTTYNPPVIVDWNGSLRDKADFQIV